MAGQKFLDETGNFSSGGMSRRQLSSLMRSAKCKDEVHEEEGGCDHSGTIPQDGRALLKEKMKAYDDVTGADLDPKLVKKVRQDEMASFPIMDAYIRCPRQGQRGGRQTDWYMLD